jgi:hypothetical protein
MGAMLFGHFVFKERNMFSIDWNDEALVPTWANYIARDSDGHWYWFEGIPTRDSQVWYCPTGQILPACDIVPNFRIWEASVEYRYSHIRVCTPGEEKAVDDALGISLVSFRIDDDVLAKIEAKAREMGIIPKALMRSIITSYVEGSC